MSSGSLGPDGIDLTDCCSNLFTLAEINGLKWCKYTGAPCSLDSPLDDPVLLSFATALERNVLCSWRHAPPLAAPKLNQGITCSESSKELWLFWYGDDPRTIDIVDKNLKESDHGSWETGFPNEAKVLLFKAFHNALERNLLSRDYVRVGKWFVSLNNKTNSEDRTQLFFSFAFCLQESKICMTVDVKQLPGVRHLVPNDLTNAAAVQGDFKVILGPYGIAATLTGHSYQLNGVGVSKLVNDWKHFYPLNVVDDWSNVPEGIEHDVPIVVGVMVGDNFIKYPSHYVLVSLEDEMKFGCSCKSSFAASFANSPMFPMTPPASPFPTAKTTDRSKTMRVPSTAAGGIEGPSTSGFDDVTKGIDNKAVACELINNSWKDIRATKSASKSSGSAQGKPFSSTFKSDQEALWNFKEPLSRKSCSCTSNSNISRSRVPPPSRSPFGINRPSQSPSNQSNQNSLASKLKKERAAEKLKPVLPFHQRPAKTRKAFTPASKGVPTCNVVTHVADQNRQPSVSSSTGTSYTPNESKPACSSTPLQASVDCGLEQQQQQPMNTNTLITDIVENNNNNNNENYFKQLEPPNPTRLSEAVRSVGDRKPSDSVMTSWYRSRGHMKTKLDIWKCYDVFTGDPKLKPRLPEDVLNQKRDVQTIPLTSEHVEPMQEDAGEVFTIQTVENENYQKKRSIVEEPVPEPPVPRKRRRSSSSAASQSGRSSSTGASQSGRSTSAATSQSGRGKTRSSRSNSLNKSQVPTPSPEPTISLSTDHVDKHTSSLPPVPTPPSVSLRSQDPSTDGSAANSPATVSQPATTSKPTRSTKGRRGSRKSQDKNKNKDPPKQETVAEPALAPLPPLASPPTPKRCVSLRTEKDLQVTSADLDKLFDSADEDEDENKMRGPAAQTTCLDALSPPVSLGNNNNDDVKTKNNASTNNAPGVVPLTDLVRMFPTPPSLENHQLSPNTNNATDHFYPTNASQALTPPEFAGHHAGPTTVVTYTSEIGKTGREETNQILNAIKELPPIFEAPTRQDYVTSCSMFAPLKSLPSSLVPALPITDDMVYVASASRQKAVDSRSDSASFLGGHWSLNPRSNDPIPSIIIPDLGGQPPPSVFSNPRSSISSPLPPREMPSVEQRPRRKYTPLLGERNCDLLNANLFLSDSYLNYLPDRSLDCADACTCSDHNVLRHQLTMTKEPMGFTRNIDVCACGLRGFERDKLTEYGGGLSVDRSPGGSCVDDIGVALDRRYTRRRGDNKMAPVSTVVVKTEPQGKPSEETKPPCEAVALDLFETTNSEVLVECLLNQFSSSLAANATSEKIVVTDPAEIGDRDMNQFQLKSEAALFSKNAVDFLFHLKPVIHESLHKAIRWKTWEQLSSVQGPLSLKEICLVNGKGSLNATEPARIPRVIVGHDSDWLSVSPLALQYWEKMLLEPYTSSRDVAYIVLTPENDAIVANVKLYFKELSSIYETCLLGHHVPVTGKVSSAAKGLREGILKIGQTSSSKFSKNAVGKWFTKYDNVSDGPRMKLFAQVCRYELGPFIEKLAKERLVVKSEKAGDENSSKIPFDPLLPFASSDVDSSRDSNAVSLVVYIVNPFDEAEDQSVRKDSYFTLLRSFSEMAATLSPAIRSRLVLEVVPLRQVTQVDAYQKTKGSHVSFVKLLKTTAFSVFSRCRKILHKPPTTRTHARFWATPSKTPSNKNQLSEHSVNRVHCPPYILASPPKLVHNVATVDTAGDLSLHKVSSNLLFCCYGLSLDHRWLLAVCTNDTGLIMETFVTVLEPTGSTVKQRRTRLRIKALRRLWEFCQGVTSCMVSSWRLVVGKLGRFTRNELRDWDEIIRNQSSTENCKPCNACLSPHSHANFESVSLVSLHRELCLRIHLAKVSSPFTSYQEPSTALVECVTRPRISATYIVINVESAHTSSLSHMEEIGGPVVDPDLLTMPEPHTGDDDDDMAMIPLFGSIANILPPSKPLTLLHPGGFREGESPMQGRPSSAPNLSGSATFVPISAQSPHTAAVSDQCGDVDRNAGFPLAHGHVFTTAPLSHVFTTCSRDNDVDGSSPVVLKATLMAHHVDDTGCHSNHVLSSTVHTSVLRYILEHYDALSWLSVDSVSKDRTSCLPIHYTALQQMTHAFNRLLQ